MRKLSQYLGFAESIPYNFFLLTLMFFNLVKDLTYERLDYWSVIWVGGLGWGLFMLYSTAKKDIRRDNGAAILPLFAARLVLLHHDSGLTWVGKAHIKAGVTTMTSIEGIATQKTTQLDNRPWSAMFAGYGFLVSTRRLLPDIPKHMTQVREMDLRPMDELP